MTEPSDVLVRLRDVPGAPPDDATLVAVLAAGHRHRRARRRVAVASAAASVAVVVAAGLLVAPPFGRRPGVTPAGGAQCRLVDLRVTNTGLNVEESPEPNDSESVRIQTRRRCAITGPFELQVRGAGGAWTVVPLSSGPYMHHVGDTGPQTSTTIRLDPATTYLIDLGWRRQSTRCATRPVRLSGRQLVLPLTNLPQWCGQPVSVSNTFAAEVTRSVPWLSAVAHGTDLAISYHIPCRGAHAVVTETARTVTVAMVATFSEGPGGCLGIGFDPVTVHATLRQPLGDRKLLHARVGPWPAITP